MEETEHRRYFVYRPTPKAWVAIMLALSLLIHVSFLGIAAIWRTRNLPPAKDDEPPELIAAPRPHQAAAAARQTVGALPVRR